MERIETKNAPLPFGTYSQAVRTGDLLFVSGQLQIRPNEKTIISDDPKTQLKQCFQNIKSICEAANFTLGDAVKINVYYTDLAVSENLNEVMEGFFNAPYPARIRVKVAGLSLNAKVEIDGVFSCKK